MTQEELQLENDKLNARLQKAISVFAEQKANITRLTEERDAANASVESLKARVSELEAKVSESSDNDEKFFEQLQEIDELKKKISDAETKTKEMAEELEQTKAASKTCAETSIQLNASLEKARETWRENNNEINALKMKVNELITSLEQRDQELVSKEKIISDFENARENCVGKVESLSDELTAANKKIEELQTKCDGYLESLKTKETEASILEDKLRETSDELIIVKNELNNTNTLNATHAEEINKLNASLEKSREIYTEHVAEIESLKGQVSEEKRANDAFKATAQTKINTLITNITKSVHEITTELDMPDIFA